MSAGSHSYVGQGSFRFMMFAVGLIGLFSAVAGPLYAIHGATRAPGDVRVFTTLQSGDASTDARTRDDNVLNVDGLPDGVQVEDDFEVTVRASDSTVIEQLLARGDLAVFGLSVGAGALLLFPVLRSIAAARPFAHGNARRIAVVAVLVGANAALVPLLPAAATAMVLRRTGANMEGIFKESINFPLIPFALVAALLVLAEAFRRGEQIADDVEGLV